MSEQTRTCSCEIINELLSQISSMRDEIKRLQEMNAIYKAAATTIADELIEAKEVKEEAEHEKDALVRMMKGLLFAPDKSLKGLKVGYGLTILRTVYCDEEPELFEAFYDFIHDNYGIEYTDYYNAYIRIKKEKESEQ